MCSQSGWIPPSGCIIDSSDAEAKACSKLASWWSSSRRLLIDDDATALKQVLASSLYRDFAMQRWDITEVDLALWEDACDAMIAEMGAAAGSWAQVLPTIASVVSEQVGFIITLHELSEGNYEAAVGMLPIVPANALAQGKRVLIRASDGTEVMRLSASQLQSIRRVMNPASNMSVHARALCA